MSVDDGVRCVSWSLGRHLRCEWIGNRCVVHEPPESLRSSREIALERAGAIAAEVERDRRQERVSALERALRAPVEPCDCGWDWRRWVVLAWVAATTVFAWAWALSR